METSQIIIIIYRVVDFNIIYVDTTESTPESTVRGAGSAGLQAALELSAAGGAPQAFGQAALTWLAPRTSDVAASALATATRRVPPTWWRRGFPQWMPPLPFHRCAWSAMRGHPGWPSRRFSAPQRVHGTPRVAADAAGVIVGRAAVDAEPARRSRVAEAFHAWLQDPAITPLALHGLTSVLAVRRPGRGGNPGWWWTRARTWHRGRAPRSTSSRRLPPPAARRPRLRRASRASRRSWSIAGRAWRRPRRRVRWRPTRPSAWRTRRS